MCDKQRWDMWKRTGDGDSARYELKEAGDNADKQAGKQLKR